MRRISRQATPSLALGSPPTLKRPPSRRSGVLDQSGYAIAREQVLRSSVGTVRRYRAATQHLEDFVAGQPCPPQAHEVRPDAFAAYLRQIEVAPNGHKNTAKRHLRDKGIRFILETCRAMYSYALKRRHLPPYAGNPFSELPL